MRNGFPRWPVKLLNAFGGQAIVEHFQGELTDTRFLEVWLGRRAGGMHASRRSMLAQSQPQLEPEPEPGVETETMDNPIASELSL